MTKKYIWEHKDHPGYFVVDVSPLASFDENISHWRQCVIPVPVLALGALNQRFNLAYDKQFDRSAYVRRSDMLKEKIAGRLGVKRLFDDIQIYNLMLTVEETEELLQLERFLDAELAK